MNVLPNLPDLAHEGRPSSASRLRPVLGKGGIEHIAGAFLPEAQGSSGRDGEGAESVAVEEIPANVFKFGGVFHARKQTATRLVMGIGYSREGAMADLQSQLEMA